MTVRVVAAKCGECGRPVDDVVLYGKPPFEEDPEYMRDTFSQAETAQEMVIPCPDCGSGRLLIATEAA